MAFIHTIEINGNARMGKVVSSTRKSENRRYVACIVTTVTEATVAFDAAQKVKAESELADWRVTLATRTALHNGMTVAQADAWTKDATTKWYGRDETTGEKVGDYNYWSALEVARKDTGSMCHDDKSSKRAHQIMVSRGFADPYDYDKNPSGIGEAARHIESLERNLASWTPPVVGTQGVLSWHGTVANAHKAVGAREAGHYLSRGYKVEVRTDIAVRETVKRGSKAVSS
jgi:hypothetical protein